MRPLTRIKLLHTIIWAIMAAAILYILYCGIIGRLTILTWISLALALGECVVIVLNKWTCPLTPLAAKHTDSREPNFDIFLPRWLAQYNKEIFGTILVVGLLLIVWRLLG
jgi:hypothetical protein